MKIYFYIFLGFLVFPACVSGGTASEDYEFPGIERIVAVGDLHGDFEGYADVLEAAGIRDRDGNWIGGAAHLVQTGDITDRGPDSRKIIDDLRKLAKKAKKAGGRVHTLIGNHEMMNMLGDLRYVHPGEYEAFQTPNSKTRQDDYYTRSETAVRDEAKQNGIEFSSEAFREQWYQDYPLGYVEHRLEWGQPKGEYYRWTIKNPVAVKINDTLFLHAGISPLDSGLSIKELNEKVIEGIKTFPDPAANFLFAEDSALWYRGLALNDEETEAPHLEELLDGFGVARIVLGHTPTGGVVLPRFDGRVVMNDVGIGEHYGGNRAFLLFEDGQWWGVHWGEKMKLPTDDRTLLVYLREVAALSPNPAVIEKTILELESRMEPVPVSPGISSESRAPVLMDR